MTPLVDLLRVRVDQLFPPLSAGEEQLSRKRSVAILFTLYTSHIFSSWVSHTYIQGHVTATTPFSMQGDRMWGFSVSLFLALLYPGSLLMPGVYGLSSGLVVTILGTVVGDWVDFNPRMRGGCGYWLVIVWSSIPYVTCSGMGHPSVPERSAGGGSQHTLPHVLL